MFLCESCGRTFENLEHYSESHGFAFGPAEEWDGCPYCGESGAVEVETCDGCGEVANTDELFLGLCADCLRKKCTYDKALAYLKERGKLGSFFCWHLNAGYEPDAFSEEFLGTVEEIFLRRKANDLLTGSTNFLGVVQYYILDDDGDFGKDDFAKFLHESGVL